MSRLKRNVVAGIDPQRVSRSEIQLQSSHALVLSDWLDVSWFYPEGFSKEVVLETPRSLIVVGESLVYKFFRYQYISARFGADAGFAKRWQLACKEMLDNREFAPDLYLGVRLLRWLEDEPHWMTELWGRELDATKPPLGADEVAIVMRRIPAGCRLSEIIENEEDLSQSRLRAVVARLSKYHLRKSRLGIEEYLQRPESTEQIERLELEKLTQFIAEYGSFIDPFSDLALREIKGYLRHFIERNEGLFTERAESGLVVDLHGALSAHNICVESLTTEGRVVSIFGRRPAAEQERKADVLCDLADLIIDLQVRGARSLSEEIERLYFRHYEQAANSDLYRFYLTLRGALRAIELFERGAADNLDAATRFLAYSLLCSLNLRQPFLLAISGSDFESCQSLAKSLAELVPIEIVQHQQFTEGVQEDELPDDWIFEKMVNASGALLSDGQSVAILWPFNREEDRIQIAQAAEKFHALPLLVIQALSTTDKLQREQSRQMATEQEEVKASAGWPRRLASARSSAASDFQLPISRKFQEPISQIMLETALPSPELALYVLRELSQISTRMGR